MITKNKSEIIVRKSISDTIICGFGQRKNEPVLFHPKNICLLPYINLQTDFINLSSLSKSKNIGW